MKKFLLPMVVAAILSLYCQKSDANFFSAFIILLLCLYMNLKTKMEMKLLVFIALLAVHTISEYLPVLPV